MSQIEEVLIHPFFRKSFVSSEHPENQLPYIGDALGRDCVIQKFVDGWMRAYSGDGSRNEDWYSWHEDVLAPFDGRIEEIHINPTTNVPGIIELKTRSRRIKALRRGQKRFTK